MKEELSRQRVLAKGLQKNIRRLHEGTISYLNETRTLLSRLDSLADKCNQVTSLNAQTVGIVDAHNVLPTKEFLEYALQEAKVHVLDHPKSKLAPEYRRCIGKAEQLIKNLK